MAARGLWLDNRSTAMDTAFGASEPFSGDYGTQGRYGQGAAPSGLSSRPYGLTQAAQGALAEPVPGNLSGSMGITSGYQGMLSAPLGHTTGLQQDSISTQRGPTPGYAGRSSALPYPERPGALSDFHRSGPEDRMGFSLPMGQMPDYNKGTSLPRGIASGDQDPFLPRQYTFDSQRPSSEIQGQLPASSRKSFEDFEYFEDYENPRELEYMGYEEPEKLNKQEENEDLEGLGELMLDRYVLPSKQDPPSNRSGTRVRNDARPCGRREENARGFSPRSGVQVRNERRLFGRHEENARGFSPRSEVKMPNERRPTGPRDPHISLQEHSSLQRPNRRAYPGHTSPLRRSPIFFPVQHSNRRSPLLSHQANLSVSRTSDGIRKEYPSISQKSLSGHQEHPSIPPSLLSVQEAIARGPAPPIELFSDSTNFGSFPANSGPLHLSLRSERLNDAPSYSAPPRVSPGVSTHAAQWRDRRGPSSITIRAEYSEPLLPFPHNQDSDQAHSGQWKSESVSTSWVSRPALSVLRGTRSTDVGPPLNRSGESQQNTPIRTWEKSDLTCVRIHRDMSTPEVRDEKPMVLFRQHFRSRSPPSSWSTNEYSHRRTRRSCSPLQSQNAFTGKLDRNSRSPHYSRYQSSHSQSRRSSSRSEHPQQPWGTRSKSPVSTVPRRQSPHSQTSGFRRSPLPFSSRSRKQSPPRQHHRDGGRSPPRHRSRGRSSHRSHARSRSPLPRAYQLKNQSPDSLDRQKRPRNRPSPRMHSKGRSRSRHHSPFGARGTNSRSPRSKKNSPQWKTANSKTSSKTRSKSPETRAKKRRGRSPARSYTSRNESKSTKGRTSPMSPSKKLSATNGGNNKSPLRSLSKSRSLQSRHGHIRSPPRSNSNSLSRLSTSESRPYQNVSRPHENQSSSSLQSDQSTEQSKQWTEIGVINNESNLMPSEDLSHTGIKRSQNMSKELWASADHPEYVQSRALSPSLKETRLWQSAESLDDPVENAKSSNSSQQHFGVMIRPFPHHCSNKDISFNTFRIFKTFGHVTSIEIHNGGENRFCLVFYRDPGGQKCALEESRKVELFHQAVSVAVWEGPETESRVVFRPLSRGQVQQTDKKATKTLLIRNLDAKLARGDIHLSFQAFGKILEINMKKKVDDRGCYAFVQYSDITSVTRAIKEMDGVFFGDYKINLSYGNTEPTECVWIDGLPSVAEITLIKLFSRHGSVAKVAIDNMNNKALVFFREVEDAKRAINFMKGKKISGCPVMLDFANRECQMDFYSAMNITNKVTAQLHEFLLTDKRNH